MANEIFNDADFSFSMMQIVAKIYIDEGYKVEIQRGHPTYHSFKISGWVKNK